MIRIDRQRNSNLYLSFSIKCFIRAFQKYLCKFCELNIGTIQKHKNDRITDVISFQTLKALVFRLNNQ